MSATSVFLVQRRATLLMEEFLIGLGASYVSSLGSDEVGFDTMAFFTSEGGGTRVIAIELKATEREISGHFLVPARTVERLASTNIPALIVVVDVKRNEVFYSWARDALQSIEQEPRKAIPLRHATDAENARLRHEILGEVQMASASS